MKTEIDYTPSIRQLAELFCNLGSDEMAKFFTECRDISQAWPSAHGIYMVALYMQDDLPPESEGRQFLMDLAAPFFKHTLDYCDNLRKAAA